MDDVMEPATGCPVWAQQGDTFTGAMRTMKELPPGYYRLGQTPDGNPTVKVRTITADHLLDLPGSAAREVMAEFSAFWKRREHFRRLGLLHKRGILLWGPPGSGKTAALMLMARAIVEQHQGLVCQIEHPGVASMALELIRQIEPERPIVALIEDLDALVQRFKEDAFLSLLDGENQVDRIVYIATTNYPRRLDKRFTDRPSRFDLIKEVGMPTEEARRAYLLARDPTLTNVGRWVELTNTLSLAHLREVLILVQCFGVPLEEAADRVHKMRNRKLTQLGPDEA